MRIVFFGASRMGYLCCQKMIEMGQNVVSIFTMPREFEISYSPEKPVQNVLYRSFDDLAKKFNLPITIVKGQMNHYVNEIKQLKPDLLCVIGWYYKISKSMLELAPKGCVGIHASILPKYRGGAPLVWAMINGEKSTGVSFFYIDEEIDEGDIIAQQSFEIGQNDTIHHVLEKAERASLALIDKYIPKIANGSASCIKQNHAKATCFRQRNPDDGEINWSWETKQIYDFIRAQTKPYPGAFTIIGNKKVTIWDAKVEDL